MLSKQISIYLIALLLLISSSLLIASPTAAAWIPSTTLHYEPDGTIYHQETSDLAYELQISSIFRASSVEITSFKHRLDWESSPTEVLPSKVVIALPGTYTFHRSVLVPPSVSDGTHIASISITGRASGDWFASTRTWSQEIVVASRPSLQLSISGNPSGGAVPLVVDFTSTVSGGTPPYSYVWTFGDGQTGSQANPSHSFSSAGSFTAALTVQDALGRTAEDTFEVTTHTPLQIDVASDARSGSAPLTVHFSSSATGGSPTYSYFWNFGDGSTSSEASPSHRYSEAGTYQVSLAVTDSQSRQETYLETITVSEAQGFNALTDNGKFLILGVIVFIAAMTVALVKFLERKKVKPPHGPET